MATSGSSDFSLNRDQVISLTLLNLGVIAQGGTASAAQTSNASLILNSLCKMWHGDGIPLWGLVDGYILPITGTNTTSSPTAQTVLRATHADRGVCDAYTLIREGTAATSGASQIVVDTTTLPANSDIIGVELDNGEMLWSTVTSSSSSTITIANALTDDVAVGNHIYYYTSGRQRITRAGPERLVGAWRVDTSVGNAGTYAGRTNVPLRITPFDDFFNIAQSYGKGEPHSITYVHWKGATSSATQVARAPEFQWYPPFQDGKSVIYIRYHREIEDLDGATDDLDFPSKFNLAIIWGLSALLAPGYGIPLHERNAWWNEAQKLKEEALDSEQEEGSLYMSPAARDDG